MTELSLVEVTLELNFSIKKWRWSLKRTLIWMMDVIITCFYNPLDITVEITRIFIVGIFWINTLLSERFMSLNIEVSLAWVWSNGKSANLVDYCCYSEFDLLKMFHPGDFLFIPILVNIGEHVNRFLFVPCTRNRCMRLGKILEFE